MIQQLLDLTDNMNSGKKFDAVLMNPPYDNKLHEKFLMKVFEISKEGISIQPAVFMNKGNRYRKSFKNIINACKKHLTDVEIINHADTNKYFGTGNSIQECGIFVWSENGTLDLENFGYENDLEKSVYEKTNIDRNESMALIRGGGHKYIDIKTYKIQDNEVPIYQWHGAENCYDAVIVDKKLWDKKAKLILVFNDENEANNFKQSLKTNFANWWFKNYVIPGDYKILTYMFRMKDYSKPWTDERFYKEFNLTEEEIKFIENE